MPELVPTRVEIRPGVFATLKMPKVTKASAGPAPEPAADAEATGAEPEAQPKRRTAAKDKARSGARTK